MSQDQPNARGSASPSPRDNGANRKIKRCLQFNGADATLSIPREEVEALLLHIEAILRILRGA